MLAFTFPGQGSQSPGMGAAWTDHESWELVDEASEASRRDVAHLLLHADADELKATKVAMRWPLEPTFLVPHDVSDYLKRRSDAKRAERANFDQRLEKTLDKSPDRVAGLL